MIVIHHHASSALGQVPGTHLLHLSLSPAILFISTYPSLLFLPFFSLSSDSFSSIFSLQNASFRSLIIPFLGLPVRLLPTTLPSITSLNKPSPLNTCPIQFFCRCLIVLIKHLSSLTLAKTSSLCTLSIKLIFFNPLHNHASNASNLLISSCNNVHVSHPYNTTGQLNTFTIPFFNLLLNPFVKNCFLLLNASFAIAILTFTSLCMASSIFRNN